MGKLDELKKENEELKKKIEELETDEQLQEIENPYTVTNRSINELVKPKDTMLYLSGNQITLVLTAYEFARLPEYFGEKPVNELSEYADKLKYYLVSKGGRGRRDVLRVLRVTSGQSRENVNKSIFKQLLGHGKQDVEDEEE